jgi:hypothetical protein
MKIPVIMLPKVIRRITAQIWMTLKNIASNEILHKNMKEHFNSNVNHHCRKKPLGEITYSNKLVNSKNNHQPHQVKQGNISNHYLYLQRGRLPTHTMYAVL